MGGGWGEGVDMDLDVYYTFKWSDAHFSACEEMNVGKSWIKDVNPDTMAGGGGGGIPSGDNGLKGLDYS